MSRPRSRGVPFYGQRLLEAKRKGLAKLRAVASVCAAIEKLWRASVASGNAFTPQERQSIAAAQHALRSVEGGWANRTVRR